MKAITLWQPWATFVAMKWKPIETRTHERFKGLKGQRIAIHAAQKLDLNALFNNEYLPDISTLQFENLVRWVDRCRGHIVCTAHVTKTLWTPDVDFVERDEWERQAMCGIANKNLLFLDEIDPLGNPVPYRGRQGCFNVPDEVLDDGH